MFKGLCFYRGNHITSGLF